MGNNVIAARTLTLQPTMNILVLVHRVTMNRDWISAGRWIPTARFDRYRIASGVVVDEEVENMLVVDYHYY